MAARPRVWCDTCGIAVESEAKLAQHVAGKKHARMLRQLEGGCPTLPTAGSANLAEESAPTDPGLPTHPADPSICAAVAKGKSVTEHPRTVGRGSAGKPVVEAILLRDWRRAEHLIVSDDGPRWLRDKNANGMTPVMMAVNGCCGSAKHWLLDLMLSHGGAETLAERVKGRTAAGMATAQNHHALAARLQAMEPVDEPGRCELCGEKFKPRSRTPLHFLGDCVRRGTEENRLIRCFYEAHPAAANTIAGPVFHRVNSCIKFRKELSETMAVVAALAAEVVRTDARSADPAATATGGCADGALHGSAAELDLDDNSGSDLTAVDWAEAARKSADWHILDLCCGKSLTASVAALLLPGAVVTCVDRCPPSQLPHYPEAGLGDRVRYVQVDMLAQPADGSDPFVEAVAAAHTEQKRPRLAVLGVHCCGALSTRAIDAHTALKGDCLLLLPCCLPRKDDPRFPPEIFSTSMQEEQYARWARFLEAEAGRRGAARTSAAPLPDVVSVKNVLVSASGCAECPCDL